jgi:sulfur-oxidizing protein SoxA
MIDEQSRDFPTTSYNDSRQPRPPQQRKPPATAGDPEIGKRLAYDGEKGRCLTCHVLGADSAQPGNVGTNLSDYGARVTDAAFTYQQVWDARVHNPSTMMPPFGTNELLTEREVSHIVAFLHTLTRVTEEPARPGRHRTRRDKVFVTGEDLTLADDYIDAGRAEFARPGHNGRSCASCHSPGKSGPDLKGAAATYPRFEKAGGYVSTLEDRVNRCRREHMGSPPIDLGTPRLNVLASYLRYLSRGVPIRLDTSGPAAEAAARGKRTFARKAGQLNFSCADCHTAASGKWLRGQRLAGLETVAGDWPKHFIAAHDLGLITLQQRIRHCQIVVRTFPLPLGSREYNELELYLTSLANGTPVWAPTQSRLRGQ